MPQVELKFSNDITLDVRKIFKSIEQEINKLDDSAGACKSRAYPIAHFLHTHVLMSVSVLQKPHRDELFMNTCLKQLEAILEATVPNGCYYAVDLFFSGNYYSTHQKSGSPGRI